MPPRITRNSHRPRASDRTMVDLEHQFGLPLFRTRWHRHHLRRKLMSMGNRPSFSSEVKLQWAGSRERNLGSGRGRLFFLTSLFIELIDPGRPFLNECNRLVVTVTSGLPRESDLVRSPREFAVSHREI